MGDDKQKQTEEERKRNQQGQQPGQTRPEDKGVGERKESDPDKTRPAPGSQR